MTTRSTLALVLAAFLVLPACSTTYTRDGQEIPADFAEAQLEEVEAVDADARRIEAAVEAVSFERGTALLQNLQWLIAQKELAISAIAEHLEGSNLRTKANLLYVLGFTRTHESTAALTAHMHHKDKIVRYEAAAGLLNHGDTTAVPVLVDFLDHPDRRLRYKAIQVLKKGTGRDFDYQFAAPAESRAIAIGKWRSWWAREKQRLMYRPTAEK